MPKTQKKHHVTLYTDRQSKIQRPTKHIIGNIWDGLLRVKWPNQQCQVLRIRLHTHKVHPPCSQ